MTPTKGDVKNWLKAIGKDRDWLARECGTEKGTVNNWLSPSGPFPSNAILKIHSLMSGRFSRKMRLSRPTALCWKSRRNA